jgi:hypothetical protein
MVDWLSAVREWPMHLNDRIGDCTCASAAHIIEAVSTYGQGATAEIGDEAILEVYSAVSGYDPRTGENDNGAVMQDVLDLWRKVGIGGHQILAFAEVDISDRSEVDAAVNLFGHVYLGLNVPYSALDQFDKGQAWDVVRRDGGNAGGHAVHAGYFNQDERTLKVVTWARVQGMTDAFWARYVEEAWVAVTPEWLNEVGQSPAGLDLYGLGQALAELTGGQNPFRPPEPPEPPPPGPAPAPGPSPEPVPPVDADRALGDALRAWLDANGRTVSEAHARFMRSLGR